MIGLGKKMLIANIVGRAGRPRSSRCRRRSSTPRHAWLGVVCYTLQIYFDFSGYSDMAIGLGRMFGFRFLENFDYPYVAHSITEFWRRWHISLSTWFRDYLYIPLGGNRGSPARDLRNLLIVFFLCGLWHGASWTFVVWGALPRRVPGARARSAWPRARRAPARRSARLRAARRDGRLGLLPRRLAGDGVAFLRAMFGLGAGDPDAVSVRAVLRRRRSSLALVAGILGSMPDRAGAGARSRTRSPRSAPGPASRASCRRAGDGRSRCCSLLASMLMAARTYNPFIYFRF